MYQVTTDYFQVGLQAGAGIALSVSRATGDVNIYGELYASAKHFRVPDKDHPGQNIIYTSIEGKDPDIVTRGKIETKEKTYRIELPREWRWLAKKDSITVHLTAIDYKQNLCYTMHDEYVEVRNTNLLNNGINCAYLVLAEREVS